ncbi:hypothetical protein H1Q59_07545 [Holosporaceae bacterium 'Namur']|nr:hypothetical protein [Holosporaceae bacterium 'Namur']
MAELTTEDKKAQAIRALDIIKSLMKRGVGDPTLLLKSALNIIEGSGLGLEYTDELFFAFYEGMKIYQVIQSIKDAALTNDVEHLNTIKDEIKEELKQFKIKYAQTYINAGLIDEIIKDPNSKEAKKFGAQLIESYKNTAESKERISKADEDIGKLEAKKNNLNEKLQKLEKHPHHHLPNIVKLISKIKNEIFHLTHEIEEAKTNIDKDRKGLNAFEQTKERMGKNYTEEDFLNSFLGEILIIDNQEKNEGLKKQINNIESSQHLIAMQLNKSSYNNEIRNEAIKVDPRLSEQIELHKLGKELNIQDIESNLLKAYQQSNSDISKENINKKTQPVDKKMVTKESQADEQIKLEKINKGDLEEAQNIISKFHNPNKTTHNKDNTFTSKEEERRNKGENSNLKR